MLPQQSAAERHAPIAATHAQRPPVHARPLQQSLALAHDPLALLQQVPLVPPVLELQVTEPQHRLPPLMQLMPEPTQAVFIIWQVPPWQTRGLWQSELDEHMPPAIDCCVQRPLRHESSPQHSVSAVHEPLTARQQRLVPCALEHIVPAAHIDEPGVQVEPAGSVMPLEQVLPAQVRPEQQSLPDEHDEPLALQRRQVPPMHWKAGLEQVGDPPPIAAQHC